MRIHQLLDSPPVFITNEEHTFIKNHHDIISIYNLRDREEVIARNLVRKGIYEISNDSSKLILKNAKTQSKII